MAEVADLVGAFFGAVSFAEGQAPAYDSLHALVVPRGLFIKNSDVAPEIATVDEFIAPRQALVDRGELTEFSEFETHSITEMFGQVAHRLSAYGKRGVANGVPFTGEGVISTQCVLTPDGWRISAMAWDDARPGLSIPDRYRA